MSLSLRKMAFSELSFWLVGCAIALYIIFPLRQSLRFGIDLVGGTYLTLEVQTDKAVQAELVENMYAAEAKLKKADLPIPQSKMLEGTTIVLSFATIQDVQSAATYLKDSTPELSQCVEGTNLKLSFPDATIDRIKKDAVERNVDVLRTRMRDIPVAVQGERNIVIELPDTANPQEAKSRIGKAAQLELRLVEDAAPTKEDILYKLDGDIPADKEILPGSGDEKGFYLVEKYADVTGRLLKEARAGYDDSYKSVVLFRLNDAGAEKFYNLTSKHYGRRLAITLDGVVISAPQISEPIAGGSGRISGNFTAETARELALLLQSGSFVAPVTFEEERQIGPALGQESIRQGLMSCLVGMILLFFFSIYYYSLAGLFAFITLLYNLVLIILGLAWLQMPLTLPGIGGMVLTVGMAIDASILIYEHIKDELSRGVSVNQAVNNGFSGAMMVILDSNITTFITGVVLYYFGTGPIQGFAVTMMLGIIATLVTGLFFLRAIFKFMLNNFHVQKLRI
jgi:preprotein translocase subunit SecD